ncbi:hypothetical protein [Amycolatopsis sp. cmx-11-51]|uniref:hypothetical protein n=1 Tax=Amycolatopsis sp. cmx-11-51 TaxID=2785797 RepID=UPI0039E41057
MLTARLLAAACLAVGAITGITPAAAGAAALPAADPQPLTFACPVGTQATRFNPGFNVELRDVAFDGTGTFGGCVGVLPDPRLPVTGNSTVSGRGLFSCLVPGAGSGTFRINWNTGRFSTIQITFVTARPNGNNVVIQQGTVTGGLFQGYAFRQVIVLATTDVLACYTEQGVKATAGPSDLLFTKI